MAKIGVCLSGCGVNDGAEIHESVITALALDRAGAEILYTAPDVEQTKVVNHLTGDEMNESRNVLVESARIARGEITDIAKLTSDDMDALLFPGGFGAALNLCDFALKGADCDIHPGVNRIIHEMMNANKPLGFICIAPALFARQLADLQRAHCCDKRHHSTEPHERRQRCSVRTRRAEPDGYGQQRETYSGAGDAQ